MEGVIRARQCLLQQAHGDREHTAHWGKSDLGNSYRSSGWGRVLREPGERLPLQTQLSSPEGERGAGSGVRDLSLQITLRDQLWDPWTPCDSLLRHLTLILPFPIDAKQTPRSPFFFGMGSSPKRQRQRDRLLSSWVREQTLWRWPAPQPLPNPSVPKAGAGATANSH